MLVTSVYNTIIIIALRSHSFRDFCGVVSLVRDSFTSYPLLQNTCTATAIQETHNLNAPNDLATTTAIKGFPFVWLVGFVVCAILRHLVPTFVRQKNETFPSLDSSHVVIKSTVESCIGIFFLPLSLFLFFIFTAKTPFQSSLDNKNGIFFYPLCSWEPFGCHG
jgi:hypothetical protein